MGQHWKQTTVVYTLQELLKNLNPDTKPENPPENILSNPRLAKKFEILQNLKLHVSSSSDILHLGQIWDEMNENVNIQDTKQINYDFWFGDASVAGSEKNPANFSNRDCESFMVVQGNDKNNDGVWDFGVESLRDKARNVRFCESRGVLRDLRQAGVGGPNYQSLQNLRALDRHEELPICDIKNGEVGLRIHRSPSTQSATNIFLDDPDVAGRKDNGFLGQASDSNSNEKLSLENYGNLDSGVAPVFFDRKRCERV